MSKLSLLIGAGVAAVTAAVVAHRVIAEKLVSEAVDREEPTIVKKAKEAMTDKFISSKYAPEAKTAADELIAKNLETVSITARDGINLVGHIYPAENPKRVIVAMHGWRSSWTSDFGLITPFWHESGCTVVYPEQRGQNGSEGDYMSFGLLERFDCADWAKWADGNIANGLPVYLVGLSMGATTVLMASGDELPASVKGIIADCGFTSPAAIMKHVANEGLHVAYGIYQPIIDDLFKKKFSVPADSYSTVTALETNTLPVLFIHGTDDNFVPVTMTYENYKACKAPKRLFVVPGADHAESFCVDKDGYISAVLEFFDNYD